MRTFLNGTGRSDAWTASMLEGRAAYSGDDLGISAVGECWGEANAKNDGVSQLKSP
jgi:hypothetical protein